MKKYILIIAATLGFAVAACAQNKTAQKGPVELGSASFCEKVYDFAADKEGVFKFKGTRPAVIDFNATWCGPCREFAPSYEAVAKEYAGKADFYSVDIDKAPEVAKVFGIKVIPTIIYITKDGKCLSTVGSMSEEEFKAHVEENLFK